MADDNLMKLPDVHFDEVVPTDQLKIKPRSEEDEDPESEKAQEETRQILMDMLGIDIDDLFDEDGNVKENLDKDEDNEESE